MKRPIKSFVKRHRRLTASQAKAFEQHYGFVLPDSTPLLLSDVFAKSQPLVVEIGFGNAEAFVAMAEQIRDHNFIGIEVHPPGVGQALRLIAEKELTNVRVYQADAMQVLAHCLPEHSVDRVNLFFPDPWPKKKHHKRRIVRPEFLQLLRRVMAPGAYLHFATDWQPYVTWVRDLLDVTEGFKEVPYQPEQLPRFHTKFEARGERLGHEVSDLAIQYGPPEDLKSQ